MYGKPSATFHLPQNVAAFLYSRATEYGAYVPVLLASTVDTDAAGTFTDADDESMMSSDCAAMLLLRMVSMDVAMMMMTMMMKKMTGGGKNGDARGIELCGWCFVHVETRVRYRS